MLLLNAFSVNMLAALPATVKFTEITLDAAQGLAREGLTSAIGHADTAAVVGTLLGVPVQANRATVVLGHPQTMKALVAQYTGPRLPEGETTLPEGATLRWFLVELGERSIDFSV